MAGDSSGDFARKSEEARNAAAKCEDAVVRNQWLQVAEMWQLLAEQERNLRKLTDKFSEH